MFWQAPQNSAPNRFQPHYHENVNKQFVRYPDPSHYRPRSRVLFDAIRGKFCTRVNRETQSMSRKLTGKTQIYKREYNIYIMLGVHCTLTYWVDYMQILKLLFEIRTMTLYRVKTRRNALIRTSEGLGETERFFRYYRRMLHIKYLDRYRNSSLNGLFVYRE